MKNRLLISRILFHHALARTVPISWSGWVEKQALELLALAPTVGYTLIKDSKSGMPFLGKAACQNIDCRESWSVFAPQGIDPEIELECLECGHDTGMLI